MHASIRAPCMSLDDGTWGRRIRLMTLLRADNSERVNSQMGPLADDATIARGERRDYARWALGRLSNPIGRASSSTVDASWKDGYDVCYRKNHRC